MAFTVLTKRSFTLSPLLSSKDHGSNHFPSTRPLVLPGGQKGGERIGGCDLESWPLRSGALSGSGGNQEIKGGSGQALLPAQGGWRSFSTTWKGKQELSASKDHG